MRLTSGANSQSRLLLIAFTGAVLTSALLLLHIVEDH